MTCCCCKYNVLYNLIFSYLCFSFFFCIYKDSQFNNITIKSSKIQLQNKTQTFRKSCTFLNKVCTRRGHININNNNNNDIDKNDNMIIIYIYIYIYIYEDWKREEKREREKKIIDIYLRHKGIQWKNQDYLIQRKCFQS